MIVYPYSSLYTCVYLSGPFVYAPCQDLFTVVLPMTSLFAAANIAAVMCADAACALPACHAYMCLYATSSYLAHVTIPLCILHTNYDPHHEFWSITPPLDTEIPVLFHTHVYVYSLGSGNQFTQPHVHTCTTYTTHLHVCSHLYSTTLIMSLIYCVLITHQTMFVISG